MSLVAIHKLPFPNPSDLLYASKRDLIDKNYGQGSHWGILTIPEMCLHLKQGAGRLIRNHNDKGVIALLDARLNYKNYKNQVLRTLPPAKRTQRLEMVDMFFENNS